MPISFEVGNSYESLKSCSIFKEEEKKITIARDSFRKIQEKLFKFHSLFETFWYVCALNAELKNCELLPNAHASIDYN